MKSQKEISFQIISSLRNEGKNDERIIEEGMILLLSEYRKGNWINSKMKDPSDSEILKYSKSLLKNWIKKDPRLNDGKEYSPKNPREKKESSPDYGKILEYLRMNDPESPSISKIESEFPELRKIG